MFDEYDIELIKSARKVLNNVYEYNYGNTKLSNQVSRLATILNKIDALLLVDNMDTEV